MKDYQIRKVLVDSRINNHSLVDTILSRIGGAEVKLLHPLEDISDLSGSSFEETKKTLFLTLLEGDFVKRCPGTGPGYLCCGYRIINQQINCPLDCSYCILQDYLGPTPLIVYVNLDSLKSELENYLQRHRGRILRIGTGELADSLALDYLGDFSTFFASLFSARHRHIFEFKTKTDRIENLLSVSPGNNIVVSWSLNPKPVIEKEENLTSSLEERLKAAYLLQEKGFWLGFHFDPVIFYSDWEDDYEKLIDNLFSFIDHSRVLWISFGALRFPLSLKKIIQRRFPDSRIVYEEMIRGLDGKFRYIKPLRIRMFRRIYKAVRERAPQVFCYFCMESPDVWERIMGFSPSSSAHLEHMFEQYLANKLGS